MHYIIGDVHGHYDTLMRLVDRLPQDAELIFVGDLIDRGSQSAEVVKFVRDGGYRCVMGNHEYLMDGFGSSFVSFVEQNEPIKQHNTWYTNEGIATLLSYGLVKREEGALLCDEDTEALEQFKDDLAWMKSLPLYIELDSKHASGKPIVISHACVGSVWHFHDDPNNQETFTEYALWNRKHPLKEMPIFNIFGHTPVEFGVEIEESYVNVDTGCYFNEYGYGELSAYCVETGEVVKINRRLEELKKVDANVSK
jgi:serine/threonine protein phosphatase 1